MYFLDEVARLGILLLSSLLGANQLPIQNDLNWKIESLWVGDSAPYELRMYSDTVASKCGEQKDAFLSFPSIQLGRYEIFSESRKFVSFGNAANNEVRSFYGAPYLSCAEIGATNERIYFKVHSHTFHYAKLYHFPEIVSTAPIHNIFGETLNVVAAGGLILLALFNFIVFWGKVPNRLVVVVTASCVVMSIYFLLSVQSFFGIALPIPIAHRWANVALWSGLVGVYKTFNYFGYVRDSFFRVLAINVLVGLSFILFGTNGDTVAFGVILPFGLATVTAIDAIVRLSKSIAASRGVLPSLQLFSFFLFLSTGTNDICVTVGIYNAPMIFALGFSGGMLFLLLAVNQRIVDIYRERDFLRANLEAEVERKTSELKSAQAELVQSAKLASLGTLSAGLAHEINNAINYVNGALLPLERMLDKSVQDPSEKQKVGKLMGVMKDGLNLTVEIIRSLRNYSGLNQAKFNDVQVLEIVKSVTTILKNKLRDKIELVVNIEPELMVHGSVVGLNQIFMNLVTNALDAMPNGGRLEIVGRRDGGDAYITVRDSGEGIPDHLKQRIFEPFFTTKDVGKGTGLGLHIVRQEIERHKGTLSVQSKVGEGTTFEVRLPINHVGKLAA